MLKLNTSMVFREKERKFKNIVSEISQDCLTTYVKRKKSDLLEIQYIVISSSSFYLGEACSV